MKMKMRKKITTFTCSMLLMCGCVLPQLENSIFAASEKDESNIGTQSSLEQQGLFPSMDKEGNITYIEIEGEDISDELELPEEKDENVTFDLKMIIGDKEPIMIDSYDTFEEANAAMERQSKFRSVGTMAVFTNDQIRSITNGVVNFNTKGNAVTYFTEDGTNRRGYTNGAYGADAAYLGTNSEGTKVKFKMAGVTGWVDKNEVEILDYDSAIVQSVNYYEIYNGYIYHNITTNIKKNAYATSVNVGPMQSYMKAGEYYYSYDGHFFYRSYAQMIADYKTGTYANSINANNPYYNYYQFLSFRTQTSYTADLLDSTVASKTNASSKMWGKGSSFINNQNLYGANAALAFGVAANESAWGTSYYAQNRNNLFGIAAYDSNPDNAHAFSSPEDCIRQFAQKFVSISYTDPNDATGLYNGACLGDKSVGFSVKYASAPYWGETNASSAYTIGMRTGNTSDYGRYKVAIKRNHDNVNIRKEANTSSPVLYKTGVSTNYPFVVLGTVQGESVNGNTNWYKIATDAPLSNDRSRALQYNTTDDGGQYNSSISYAYVSATLVDVVSEGSGGGSDGSTGSNKKGDVNGDGIISASDYTLVKKHVLGSGALSGNSLTAADYNNDGIVSASDYTLIKKTVLGN